MLTYYEKNVINMKKSGFSLLELSIVLVIIGLIAGGIVAGSAMIRAAELRSVLTDIERFKTAHNTFRDKYLGIAGDLKNATAFWGTSTGCATDNTAGGIGTCNGDNNGGVTRPFTTSLEPALYWQHMALAGLISGSYTGEYDSGGLASDWFTAGVNLPEGSINGSGYLIHQGTGATYIGKNAPHDFIRIGTRSTSGHYNGSLFNAEESWNIDIKTDDGLASTGNVWGVRGSGSTGCVDAAASASSANYILSDETVGCQIYFWVD